MGVLAGMGSSEDTKPRFHSRFSDGRWISGNFSGSFRRSSFTSILNEGICSNFVHKSKNEGEVTGPAYVLQTSMRLLPCLYWARELRNYCRSFPTQDGEAYLRLTLHYQNLR